jgi:hypothetical protein
VTQLAAEVVLGQLHEQRCCEKSGGPEIPFPDISSATDRYLLGHGLGVRVPVAEKYRTV